MSQPALPETSPVSPLPGETGTQHAALRRRDGRRALPTTHSGVYRERRSHHEASFSTTGELPVQQTGTLSVRDGPLAIDPQADAPLQVRGNLEIITRIGRVVAQVMQAKRASALAVKARRNRFATLAMCSSDSIPFEIWRLTQ